MDTQNLQLKNPT